jgi:starvation-inducible outer membrane lipoprotein
LIFLCFSFSGCTSLPTSKESKSKHGISAEKFHKKTTTKVQQSRQDRKYPTYSTPGHPW